MQQTTSKTTYDKYEAEIVCMKALLVYDQMAKTMLPFDITAAICKELKISRIHLWVDFAIDKNGDYYVEVKFYNPNIDITMKETFINPDKIKSRINYLKHKIKESATA